MHKGDGLRDFAMPYGEGRLLGYAVGRALTEFETCFIVGDEWETWGSETCGIE